MHSSILYAFRKLLLVIKIGGLLILLVNSVSSAAQGLASLGSNIMAIKYYGSEAKFVDITKRAKPSYADKPAEPLVDQKGNFISGKTGKITLKVGARYPAISKWVVLYQGDGDVIFDNANVLEKTPGRILVDVSSMLTQTYTITITRTNSSNPVRDLHVVMADHEKTFREQPFYPPFVQFLKRYRVLRFMDWTQTNHSPQKEWSSRPKLETFSYGGDYGAPWETVFMLCNQVGADPWINVPHAATDDYVTNLGKMAKEMLNANLKVYLELSNEVWLFDTQNKYYGGTSYQTKFSERSVQVFKLFGDALGDPKRLVRVFGGRVGAMGTNEKILTHNDNYKKGDALAIAPYFGSDISKGSGFSAQKLLDLCEEDINTRQIERMTAAAELCKKYNMRLVAYEGGQHIAKQYEEQLIPANRDPRMFDLYTKHLANWKKVGGEIFCHFSTIGEFDWFGGWGVKEYMDQPIEECPKLRAIDAFMAANPVWWEDPGVASIGKAESGYLCNSKLTVNKTFILYSAGKSKSANPHHTYNLLGKALDYRKRSGTNVILIINPVN